MSSQERLLLSMLKTNGCPDVHVCKCIPYRRLMTNLLKLGINRSIEEMNRVSIVVVACVALGCAQRNDQPEAVATAASAGEDKLTAMEAPVDSLPPGVVLEDFGDGLDISHAVARGGGDKYSSEGSYRKGKREGVWTEYHPSGRVKSITGYVNGRKEGQYMEFNDFGATLITC